MIKKIKKCIIITLSSFLIGFCSTGCIGCKSCGGNDDGKPVAPEVYSNESGQSGEPSLPYFKPWWKD